jgi:endonuclease/exonuclease/phosphatase family metal-dependent hydrolase
MNKDKFMRQHYRILSWNILAQPLISLDDYPATLPTDLTLGKRLLRIIQHLVYFDADLMFLQEVTPHVQHILHDTFARTHVVLPLSPHNQSNWPQSTRSEPYGNVTIYRRQMFRLRQHQCVYLHHWGTAYDESVFDLLTIPADSVQRQPLTCFNIHLDSQDALLRKQETQVLLAYLSRTPGYVIVAGDFNTNDASLHQEVVKRGMLQSVVKPSHVRGSYLCERPMIDYIYVRSGMTPVVGMVWDHHSTNHSKHTPCQIAQTLQVKGSDHHPVVGVVALEVSQS